jgi:predicted ATPase/class 3 adenylate cyclase
MAAPSSRRPRAGLGWNRVAEADGSRFTPYLPRLVRGWPRERPDAGWLELDGTLVSADVSGFTALSERLQSKGRVGAEELVLLLSGCFEGLIAIAERLGGDVLKFRGDALLVLFSGEDHERRAAYAASDMQWFIGSAAPNRSSVGPVALSAAIGAHSGACHFFLAGTSHRELLVTGPAATQVVELEDAAAAGEVLVSAATARALDADALGEERGGGARLVRLPPNAGAEIALAPPLPSGAALDEFVPQPVRDALHGGTAEGEHRRATVAFLRWRGTDGLLEREGPAAVHAALTALAERVGGVADELGVTWLESDVDRDGGKLYLVAGAPASRGANEERLLRALREIVDGVEDTLDVRAGVNRGPVFAGEVGAASRRTYAVLGDTVNLAARLMGRAERGQILSTGEVLDRARARFETESQPFLVKGKERAVTAFRVGAIAGEREEQPEVALPLIGREHELALLREAVDRARRRIGQVVELVGEPGIGKSRLVEELKLLAAGFAQLEARCGQYAASAPYFPFRSLLRPLAGLTPELGGAEAGEQLRTWIEAVMPDLVQWLPLLAIPFDVPVAQTPEVAELDPAFRMERMHDTVATFLERVLMMPTLALVEDAHWIDDASLALVRHLAARPTPRPWVLAATRRPEGPSMIAEGAPGALTIRLEPLPAEAVVRLALAAAGESALSEDELREVAERAGGNPLFVRELVTAVRDVASDELPETVESMITARIDTLAPPDRQLLRYAAVIGAVFELELLHAVAGEDVGEVRDLARWEALGAFVAWEGADTLRFRHDLFRAAAYEGLPFARRREIHARVADALLERGGAETMADLLSLHFFRADRYEEGWRWSVLAGDRARETYANTVAVQLYGRALEAADRLALPPGEVARVAETLGDVAELAARYDTAAEAYERARSLAGDDPAAAARLLRKRGVLHERQGHYDDALEWFGRATAALGDDASSAERAQIALESAGANFRQGHFEECIALAYAAVPHAESVGDRAALGRAYYLLAHANTRLGRAERDGYERALVLLEEAGDLVSLGNILNNLGIAAYFEGRWTEALEYYERSRGLRERAGDVAGAATQMNNVAEILSDQGRYDEAGRLFRDALRVWHAAGFAIGIALAKSNLGRLAARQGNFADAQGLFADALAEFEAIGAESFLVETLARRGEAYVLAGEHREALALVAATNEHIARGGADARVLPLVERVHGYALLQTRDPAGAKEALARSLAHAEELGAAYERALTLQARGDAAADAALGELGVVATPLVPLP